MKIYIIGYMFSGKSTIGKQLAKELNYQWVDTDRLFEEEEQASILDYFRDFGEAAFRQKEQGILHRTAALKNAVISTGGGLPCFDNNMQWMNEHGITIFVETPPGMVFQRYQNSKTPRPLLQNLTDEEALAKIKEQLAERQAYYEQAKVRLLAGNINIKQLADLLFFQ